MTHAIDIKDLVSMLAANAESLARKLAPDGAEPRGGEYSPLNPTRADGKPGSFKIHIDGPKAGVWKDWSTNDAGDALDLVAYLATNGDKKAAVKWARDWLGLTGAPPAELKRRKADASAAATRRRAAQAEVEERNRKRAQAIYLSAQPKLAGTPAERYLLGRGIDFARLGRQPGALRYHPALWEPETGRKLPALVAAITRADGGFAAVHRTWLDCRPDGSVVGADLDARKKTLGLYRSGCIRLWRGLRDDGKRAPALKDAPPGSEALVCEGIEDGLTLAMAAPERRILVAVSLANMAALDLPAAIAGLVIVADNDGEGSAADAQLQRAVRAQQVAGRWVRIARAPAGFKDVNDMVKGAR